MSSTEKPRRLTGGEIDRLVAQHIKLRLAVVSAKRRECETEGEPVNPDDLMSVYAAMVRLQNLTYFTRQEADLQRTLADLRRVRRKLGQQYKFFDDEGRWYAGDVEEKDFGDSAVVALLSLAPDLKP
jgi:hypothetical protein